MGSQPSACTRGLLLAAGLLALAGCHRKAAEPAPPVDLGFLATEVDPRPPATPASVARGHDVFARNCVSCHGPKGDGKGYGAPFLNPPPRDFTAGVFKLRTTPSGSMPRDEDLYRTISRGVTGTAMPAWKWFLPDPADRWALVEYIKTLSPRWQAEKAQAAIDLPATPPEVDGPASIAKGKAVYESMGCASCHGAEGMGNGPASLTLRDDWDNPLGARDFTNVAGFKGGWNEREIARTFLTGLDGTPMPSFAEAMPRDQIWALAAYVKSLGRPHPMHDVASHGTANKTREVLGDPDVRISLLERGWHYEPGVVHVKQGQVVEITLTTTDNGLGAGHGFSIDGMDDESFLNGAMVGAPKSVKFRAARAGSFRFHCVTQCSTGYLHPNMTGMLIVDPDSRG